MSTVFKINQVNEQYHVTWEEYGNVQTVVAMKLIWKAAWDTDEVKIGFGKSKMVIWIDQVLPLQASFDIDAFADDLLRQLDGLEFLVFEKSESAEKFIFDLERQITFALLNLDFE